MQEISRKPFQMLYQSFLKCEKLLKLLKEVIICPVHKKRSRIDAKKDYRHISLISHVSKIMEHIVRRLITFLEENTQHSFRPGISCLAQLLHCDQVLKQQINHPRPLRKLIMRWYVIKYATLYHWKTERVVSRHLKGQESDSCRQ